MHLGRLVPHRLIVVTALGLAGCATDRYVGSVGRDGVYANRGFGFALRLAPLLDRWDLATPRREPSAVGIEVSDDPLDLDGDGRLDPTFERTRHHRPTLRLTSRTSTASSLEVLAMILGPSQAPPEAVALREIERRGGERQAAQVTTSSTARAPLVVAELRRAARVLKVAVFDQPGFVGEYGPRRQALAVALDARPPDPGLERDFAALLDAVYLNALAGAPASQERW